MQGSVMLASLWVDQMETDMSQDSVQQYFINVLSFQHIFQMCQQLLFQSTSVSILKRLF